MAGHDPGISPEEATEDAGPAPAGRPLAAERQTPRTHTLTRHADVVAAATDPATFSSAVSRHLNVPNGMDGEEHRRYRAVVDRYLCDERVQELEPVCRAVAEEVVAELPFGESTDIVRGFGRLYAVRAQSVWLGWPRDLEQKLMDWMQANRDATRSGDPARTAEVAERFDAGIRRLVDQRRAARTDPSAPPADVTDELAHDSVDGKPLAYEEIVSMLRNWTAGDLGTIARCIGVVVHRLATDPDLQAELRERHSETAYLDAALDELLRIDDPFVSSRRVATRDTVIGGATVRAGDRVQLDWTAANRDETRFGDPDAYCPVEHADGNLVYGIGPHVCPGRALSTMELRVVIAELLARTTNIRLDPGEPPLREAPPLGGFHRVNVILS